MHSIIGEEIKTDSIIPVREKKEDDKRGYIEND